jgi:uncharacterized protein YkwD
MFLRWSLPTLVTAALIGVPSALSTSTQVRGTIPAWAPNLASPPTQIAAVPRPDSSPSAATVRGFQPPQPQPSVPSSQPLFPQPTGTPTPAPKPLFPQPPHNPEPLTKPSPPSPDLSTPVLEQQVFDQVNQYRLSIGLAPLRLDPRISEQARAHSQAMADKQIPVGHFNFKQRVHRIDRIISSRRISENVAYIFTHNDPAKRAVDGWLKSPHHRPIIEDNSYSVTGIGVSIGDRGALYFTQIYIRPR